jgi:hypothetical protein
MMLSVKHLPRFIDVEDQFTVFDPLTRLSVGRSVSHDWFRRQLGLRIHLRRTMIVAGRTDENDQRKTKHAHES